MNQPVAQISVKAPASEDLALLGAYGGQVGPLAVCRQAGICISGRHRQCPRMPLGAYPRVTSTVNVSLSHRG
jgi:hypothetical protein